MTSIQTITTMYLATIISMVGVFLVSPLSAAAYFSDVANQVDGGSIAAGSVSATISTPIPNLNLRSDEASSLQLNTADGSTLGTQSRLTFAPQSCRADFYNEILLEVTTASGTTVSSFVEAAIVEHGVPSSYTLDVTASEDLVAFANENCVIGVTLETWQTEFSEPGVGFSSVAQMDITLTTANPIGPQETTSVVLNELYPAVLGTTTEPLEREWVELYNGSGAAVDVAGWRIDEFVSGDLANASRPHMVVSSCSGVTASDHMQPYGTTDTVITPGDFLVVEFCGSAAYLADGGDTVRLYSPDFVLIDAHTYPATANGKSHARIPDGAAWVDPVPTPGNKNTATRADLEAEGWADEAIESTLAQLQTTAQPPESESEPVLVTPTGDIQGSIDSGATSASTSNTAGFTTVATASSSGTSTVSASIPEDAATTSSTSSASTADSGSAVTSPSGSTTKSVPIQESAPDSATSVDLADETPTVDDPLPTDTDTTKEQSDVLVVEVTETDDVQTIDEVQLSDATESEELSNEVID